ncbi:DUF397 domain-containing protein [Sphaerisporangium aureirubrum]|uniref:DUF397 domain-containing protein n=1 Tax=Sphaerisporangium aureirubrum TaxID=1544736 RepID=A0ABW1N9W0_9ACTN
MEDAVVTFRKSSYSAQEGQCVEIAGSGGHVVVRDSKNPGGPVLAFTTDEWRAFVHALKSA